MQAENMLNILVNLVIVSNTPFSGCYIKFLDISALQRSRILFNQILAAF